MSNNCNWRLEAISNAAKNRKKSSFVLLAGENKVGKKKDCLVKIPSVLCSREHCSIFLDGDKISVTDFSRNGTYITFSGDIGTKHYINESAERALEPNDIISFGFNVACVYDVNDKNAFIYRLVKEDIEVIDIDDSDDEATPSVPAPCRGTIHQIDNKVIDIDSDSDSEYSGDECLQNIEEIGAESNSASDDLSDDLEDSLSDDSENTSEYEDDGFVVTKTIGGTPSETIALDDDSSASEREAEPLSSEIPAQVEDKEKEPEKEKESNGTVTPEEPSTSEAAEQPKETTEKTNASADAPVDEEKTVVSSTIDDTTRFNNLKRRLAEHSQRRTTMTKAQPLKKRRQTLTEAEYVQRKSDRKEKEEERKQKRRDALAALGEKQKAAREAAAENAAESNRIPFVPKVKNTIVTRAEQVLTDMMATGSTSTQKDLP